MDELREHIVVETDGSSTINAFQGMHAAAMQASASIAQVANNINLGQRAMMQMAQTANAAVQGLQGVGQAGQQAAAGVAAAGNAAQGATNHFQNFQNAMFGHRGVGGFIWDAATDGFKSAIGFAHTFIEQMSGVQRTLSLMGTIKNSSGPEEEFQYLIRTANNYGLSLRAIQDDYAKLNLAAQNTKLSQESIRTVFEQVSMATRTLHLNQQQTQLTFLAIEQMFSKGRVSFEELRKQFAERIPGAMQALARELGVTDAVLEKFITKVGASSEKMVPVLGQAVQRLFAGGIQNASQALDAELNRVQTSIGVFWKNVLQSGGAQGMSTLLKSINDLLQVDSVATTFADAMNRITSRIAEFLRTLSPDDVKKFADEMLNFLEALGSLAMIAGRALIFLAQHLTVASGIFGALAGAVVGSSIAPGIGTVIGTVVGGLGGAALGAMASSGPGSGTRFQELQAQYREQDTKVKGLEAELATVMAGGKSPNEGFMPGILTPKRDVANITKLLQSEKQRQAAMYATMEPYIKQELRTSAPTELNLPDLPELPGFHGSPAEQLAYLKKMFRQTGVEDKMTPEERAAAALRKRQDQFTEDLASRVRSLTDPEGEKYAGIITNAKQMGIIPGSTDPRISKLWDAVNSSVAAMQADYNKKKQEESDQKTLRIGQQYEGMVESANTDVGKFRERFDIGNLKQVDDNDWATKARKMGNELDAVLLEQSKKWDQYARENPLFNFGFDREARLKEMRAMGDAYIDEFKRIEAERRTIVGGGKAFLKDWNEMATNYGKMTQEFLKGTTDGIVDMLLTAMKTGEFSFKKLGEFIFDYIMKMMIVRAITPFVNMAVDWFSGFAGLTSMGPAVSTGTSAFSLGGGGSGLGLKMPGRATGGPVMPGESYLVGERGVEMLKMGDRAGYVHPVESLRSSGNGEGGPVYVSVSVGSNGEATSDTKGAYGDFGRKVGDAVRAVIVAEKRPGGLLA